jgi:hypothetical protein
VASIRAVYGARQRQLPLIPARAVAPAPPGELAAECARFRAWYTAVQAGATEPYRYRPSPALLAEITLLCTQRPKVGSGRVAALYRRTT